MNPSVRSHTLIQSFHNHITTLHFIALGEGVTHITQVNKSIRMDKVNKIMMGGGAKEVTTKFFLRG